MFTERKLHIHNARGHPTDYIMRRPFGLLCDPARAYKYIIVIFNLTAKGLFSQTATK